MPTTEYAIVTDVRLADDGVLLILATCSRCSKTVCHGGGRNPMALVLGHRTAHCHCPDGYELADVHNVVGRRLIAIAAEVDAKASRRAAARARRAAADND